MKLKLKCKLTVKLKFPVEVDGELKEVHVNVQGAIAVHVEAEGKVEAAVVRGSAAVRHDTLGPLDLQPTPKRLNSQG